MSNLLETERLNFNKKLKNMLLNLIEIQETDTFNSLLLDFLDFILANERLMDNSYGDFLATLYIKLLEFA